MFQLAAGSCTQKTHGYASYACVIAAAQHPSMRFSCRVSTSCAFRACAACGPYALFTSATEGLRCTSSYALNEVPLCPNDKACLLVACLTSQQHASVSQGWICSDNFTCCHTEIEVADQTFHLTQSQYTDTGPTSPSTDPTAPGA